MKRHGLHIVIGLGRTIGNAGGHVARMGTGLERWGLKRLQNDHPIYQANTPSGTNGVDYRLSFLS